MSIWTSALVTGFFYGRELIAAADTPLYWLAFSSVAICINQTFTKGDA